MATFDLWQQAYTLGQQSGSVSAKQGTPSDLAAELNKVLNEFYAQPDTVSAIGTWSTIWGPVVFESEPSPTSYADNVMYVASNADKSAYVVGVAGTNPNSKYDIDQEDLAVDTTVAWTAAFPSLQPYGLPSGSDPYLSAGTALGVNNLLDMVDTLQGTNLTLVEFLSSSSVRTGQTTLIFAGHSLAGALSPPLALAFFNPNGGRLNLSDWANVYVYPTAGPTAGNADFGTYLSSVFPPTSSSGLQAYQVWNRNVMNTLDVIPHAWEISMLDQIPGLYRPYKTTFGTPPAKVLVAVAYAKDLSKKGGQTAAGPYKQVELQPLPGTFQGKPVADFKDFEDETLYQHTTAYDVLLDVASLSPAAKNQAAYVPIVRAMLSGPEGT